MSVQTVCLGWHWEPYRYVRSADGTPVAEFPEWLGRLARDAVAAAYGDPDAAAAYAPDCALINFYDETAKMGMHRDREERVDAPVVSLSIGAACTFRFGNTVNRKAPYTDVELRSGDLFVFGAPSRFAYHGVVRPGPSRHRRSGARPGRRRINYTIRVTGCSRRPSAGHAAPVLGREVGDRLGEVPVVAGEVLGRVLALAVRESRSAARGSSRHASRRARVMGVDVGDPDHHRPAARAGRGEVRGSVTTTQPPPGTSS